MFVCLCAGIIAFKSLVSTSVIGISLVRGVGFDDGDDVAVRPHVPDPGAFRNWLLEAAGFLDVLRGVFRVAAYCVRGVCVSRNCACV